MSSWLDGLTVRTDGHRGDLLDAVTSAEITRRIDGDGTTTLTLELRDPDGDLRGGPLLARGAQVDIDERQADVPFILPFELVAVDKRDRALSTTWQDSASLTLQRQAETEVTRPDASNVNRFVGQLVGEEPMTSPAFAPWNGHIGLVREPDARLGDDDDDDQLARTGNDDDGDPESSWAALERIAAACDPPRRRYSLGRIIIFASDAWLAEGHGVTAGGHQPHRWREGAGGVDKVDYQWDVGKKADKATVDVWVPDLTRITPSSPVRLDEPGDVADGLWLVEQIRWNPHSQRAKVTLTRPAELRED